MDECTEYGSNSSEHVAGLFNPHVYLVLLSLAYTPGLIFGHFFDKSTQLELAVFEFF